MANSEEIDIQPQSDENAHKSLLSWDFLERPKYRRGRLWHAVMLGVGIGLLIYSLISANFLFALIIVIFALVVYVSAVYEPSRIRFVITEDGIQVGESYYPFREIDRFWFFYEPPIARSLYLDFRGFVRPRLRVDLETQDPNAVRALLGQYIREELEDTDEPMADTLARLLKI